VGSEITARAAPDGYTIAIVGTGHSLNPSLYAKLPYDTLRDFESVSMVAFAPLVFVVHPSVQANSAKDLIALAKAKRGELNYASAGLGTAGWMSVERFKRLADVDMVHVPYKGAGDAVASVVSGQVQLLSTGPTAVVAHIKSGRLRALGVTSAKRMSLFPDLPAIAESLPGYEEQIFVAIVAPAKTPKAIVAKYHAQIARIVQLPEVRTRMDALGLVPVAWPPEQLSAYLRTEIPKWSKVFRELGIKPESW
jgi:tripartite-type tricarboxylate transporter receptor subunit TctC